MKIKVIILDLQQTTYDCILGKSRSLWTESIMKKYRCSKYIAKRVVEELENMD